MTKHQEYFKKMLENHQELFEKFEQIHANYAMDQKNWQRRFNSVGREVVDIVNDYENRLCSHTEKGQFSKFSMQLGEKFRALVKKKFPLIDSVGITVTKASEKEQDILRALKRIRLQ